MTFFTKNVFFNKKNILFFNLLTFVNDLNLFLFIKNKIKIFKFCKIRAFYHEYFKKCA